MTSVLSSAPSTAGTGTRSGPGEPAQPVRLGRERLWRLAAGGRLDEDRPAVGQRPGQVPEPVPRPDLPDAGHRHADQGADARREILGHGLILRQNPHFPSSARPVTDPTDPKLNLSTTPSTRSKEPVGYANHPRGTLSPTPATSPIGVDGVADRLEGLSATPSTSLVPPAGRQAVEGAGNRRRWVLLSGGGWVLVSRGAGCLSVEGGWLSVVDGARRAAAGGDGVAVDGHAAGRGEEGDDVGHLRGGDDAADADARGQARLGLGLGDCRGRRRSRRSWPGCARSRSGRGARP